MGNKSAIDKKRPASVRGLGDRQHGQANGVADDAIAATAGRPEKNRRGSGRYRHVDEQWRGHKAGAKHAGRVAPDELLQKTQTRNAAIATLLAARALTFACVEAHARNCANALRDGEPRPIEPREARGFQILNRVLAYIMAGAQSVEKDDRRLKATA